MAHLEKFKAVQVAVICKHDSRTQGDGTTHSNESIDDNRTHLNYNLASLEQSLPATEFLKKRLSECKVLKRADVNVMCSWAVTLPKDFEGDERKFFEQSYEFLCKRYGKENVVSAWVHNDENQPHLHFKFVPVTQGKDGDKVSAKEVVNRSDLRSFHTDLQAHLENVLQCPCNILNGVTVNGNKTIQELKVEQLKAENERLESNKTIQELKAEQLKAENECLEKENAALKEQVIELQSKVDEYTPSEKKLLESKRAYEERVKLHQTAIAIKQREQAVVTKEQEMSVREQVVSEPEKAIKKQAEELARHMTIEKANKQIYELSRECYMLKEGKDKAVKQAVATTEEKYKGQVKSLSEQLVIANERNRKLSAIVEDYEFEKTGNALSADEVLEREFPIPKKKNKGYEYER